MQDEEHQGHREDYSPARYAPDPEGSEGSFDQEVSPEEYDESYAQFPRSVGYNPVPTVGFGNSRYGPPPEAIVVARTGPAAGRPVVYRTDNEEHYRFEGRTPEQIAANRGITAHNDQLPVSLQSYQNTTQRSALSSWTRDPQPSGELLSTVESLSRYNDPNRGDDAPIWRIGSVAPGGIDLMESLGQQSYPAQQEIAHYRGVRDEYFTTVTPFGFDADGEPVQLADPSPYMPAPTQQTQSQPEYSQSSVAWAANLANPGPAESSSRNDNPKKRDRSSRHSSSSGQSSSEGHRSKKPGNKGKRR